ncbi:MAG TPA: M18 family aminopeptidase [Planctomycetota bacterium]|nr:M18 family aminopeptidase [Planctomycetota bacterium]
MTIDAVADLCRFIDASPSPMHAADALCADLTAAGFQRLDLAAPSWDLAAGRYLVRRGATVIAFIRRRDAPRRFHLIGAHTDSPHLRLRARPAYEAEKHRMLAVEVYGGALWNSWLDRDLGIAGTVHALDGAEKRVRIHRPIARVAQLAIHLDRKVNDDGVKLNPQLHLAPLWGLARDGRDCGEAFLDLIARESGIAARDIAGHDLSLYDLTACARGGADGDLLFAPRLDNLASCHAGMRALIGAGDGDARALPVLACFDHEEVGSASDTGADGALLGVVLERIAIASGLDRAAYLAALADSLMLSVDMAHAVHPNYADRHEPRHKPRLGEGPVIKSNANQRYATTAAGAARVRALAKRADVPLQDFAARGDIGCGSTIGPAAAANLGVSVVDLGNPMLSMHSARECAAVADHAPYIALLTRHLGERA